MPLTALYLIFITDEILLIGSFPFTVIILEKYELFGILTSAFLTVGMGITQLLIIVELEIRVSFDIQAINYSRGPSNG
jgi:hypothetical protein